jgi:hypothetical protein
LEASVKAIPGLEEVKKNGTNALKSSITQVQMNATTVVNEAEAQFASQTSALKSAIDTLSTSVQQVASPPTASQVKGSARSGDGGRHGRQGPHELCRPNLRLISRTCLKIAEIAQSRLCLPRRGLSRLDRPPFRGHGSG